MSMNLGRKVVATFPKFENVEVHLSTIMIGGQFHVDIREYNTLFKAYERGITIPESMLADIAYEMGLV